MPKLSARRGDGVVAIGGDPLGQDQLEALSSISVNPEDILNNLEDLNEEIEESFETVNEEANTLPEVNVPKKTKRSTMKKSAVGRPNPKKGVGPAAEARKRNQKKAKRKTQMPEMDLEQELASMEGALEERAVPEEGEDYNDVMKDQIIELLGKTKGAPSEAQINAWKRQYGDNAVHVMALGEGDVYIFTHLKRGQWKKIQEIAQKAQQTQATDIEDMLKEKVVTYCTLWPKPLPVEFFYNSRAGVVDSLYQVILLNSYFLSPQQAMLLTTQL